MIRIAIAGNIASGKSLVQKCLQERGFKVLDTDCVAHSLLENNQEVMNAFSEYDILDGNNTISRVKLGKIVFNNQSLKKKLEEILHPQIKTKIVEFFEKNNTEKFLFVGIPLLFEAKMENLFDKIIFIECRDELRLKRLMHRNGYSKEYAQQRLSSQMGQDEKIKKSDYVISNNATKEDLKTALWQLLEEID